MGIEQAYLAIEEPWFVYGMGEEVEPQRYRGDKHDRIGFWCELQHRDGGRLTRGEGQTLSEAINMAWANVNKRHSNND